MSSPMFDLPEHFLVPVNANGDGPETDPALVVGEVCWCEIADCAGPAS